MSTSTPPLPASPRLSAVSLRPAYPTPPWQLLEHLRLTQADILDFCRNSSYQERKWPDDYWPASDAPPSSEVWEQSIADLQRDREELRRLGADPKRDLFARIPHGTGQTYLHCSSWQTITPTM